MSAPERIWAVNSPHNPSWKYGAWDLRQDYSGDIEYVRADLCDPTDERVKELEAENARLRETLRTVAAWCVDAKVLSNKGHAVSAYNLAAGILRRIDAPLDNLNK